MIHSRLISIDAWDSENVNANSNCHQIHREYFKKYKTYICDLNELDEHYYSLLDYALICKNLKIIKYLINRKVKLGLTLYQINKEDIFIDKIKLLHAAEYDLNNLDIVGFAPIHYASTLGFADAIKLLMQYDIKILKTAINGDTPIKLAIKNSKIGVYIGTA